jgi:hypothetical protein
MRGNVPGVVGCSAAAEVERDGDSGGAGPAFARRRMEEPGWLETAEDTFRSRSLELRFSESSTS